MTIENNVTHKKYTVTKEGWESMGAKQKAFTVIDFKDEQENQKVGNAKPKVSLNNDNGKDDESKSKDKTNKQKNK